LSWRSGGGTHKAVSRLLAIVWVCRQSVEQYSAAGKSVVVPRPCCLACGTSMGFCSGYWRDVWVSKDVSVPIWVKRARCRRCRGRPALLPSFCLPYRRYGVGVIGPAVEAHVEGTSVRAVAAGAGLNEPAVRLWCRRFHERAEVALAVVAVIVAGLGGPAGVAGRAAETVVLSALRAAVVVMCETESLEAWPAISVWTGGMWLGPLRVDCAPRTRVFPPADEQRLMTVIDPNEPKRPP
jgi:hypothetical protein